MTTRFIVHTRDFGASLGPAGVAQSSRSSRSTRDSTALVGGLVNMTTSRFSPAPTVASEQIVGLLGPPGSGGINRRRSVRLLGPRVEHVVDVGPLLFHLVSAREERGLAAHRVEEQSLVSLGRVGPEGG